MLLMELRMEITKSQRLYLHFDRFGADGQVPWSDETPYIFPLLANSSEGLLTWKRKALCGGGELRKGDVLVELFERFGVNCF